MLDCLKEALFDRRLAFILMMKIVILLRIYFSKLIMKLIDYKRFIRNFTGMLGRNAECYADVVLPKLRHHKTPPHIRSSQSLGLAEPANAC